MQTQFSLAQLADPNIAEANSILRNCVHCGFCTATCPTYVTLGDERDSPRGRIYLIKNMLETDKPPSSDVVQHIDRCLSCLSCMTTCPSGVHYMHLVDHARSHIEKTYQRPFADRQLRRLLAWLLPRPNLFRMALLAGMVGKVIKGLLPGQLRAMVAMAPSHLPRPSLLDHSQVIPADGTRTMRVALMTGCAQKVLAPEINDATVRLLTRHGVEVVVADKSGCCGALGHHMGREDEALAFAKQNIDAWSREMQGPGLDHIIINASGCGTTVKDYGFMLRHDPAYAEKAKTISAISKDISEIADLLPLMPGRKAADIKVAYHSACSLQHGQKITDTPKNLLQKCGFQVLTPREAHLCCGSAGTYNLLQPELASRLQSRKVKNLETLDPDCIAAGNIGCMTQIGAACAIPVVHTVELLDWVTGGPAPAGLPVDLATSA